MAVWGIAESTVWGNRGRGECDRSDAALSRAAIRGVWTPAGLTSFRHRRAVSSAALNSVVTRPLLAEKIG